MVVGGGHIIDSCITAHIWPWTCCIFEHIGESVGVGGKQCMGVGRWWTWGGGTGWRSHRAPIFFEKWMHLYCVLLLGHVIACYRLPPLPHMQYWGGGEPPSLEILGPPHFLRSCYVSSTMIRYTEDLINRPASRCTLKIPGHLGQKALQYLCYKH